MVDQIPKDWILPPTTDEDRNRVPTSFADAWQHHITNHELASDMAFSYAPTDSAPANGEDHASAPPTSAPPSISNSDAVSTSSIRGQLPPTQAEFTLTLLPSSLDIATVPNHSIHICSTKEVTESEAIAKTKERLASGDTDFTSNVVFGRPERFMLGIEDSSGVAFAIAEEEVDACEVVADGRGGWSVVSVGKRRPVFRMMMPGQFVGCAYPVKGRIAFRQRSRDQQMKKLMANIFNDEKKT